MRARMFEKILSLYTRTLYIRNAVRITPAVALLRGRGGVTGGMGKEDR